MNKKMIALIMAVVVMLALGSMGVAYAASSAISKAKAPSGITCVNGACPQIQNGTCPQGGNGACQGGGGCCGAASN